MKAHTEWFEEVTSGDSVNLAARKSGIIQKTLAGQLKRGTIPAESVIKLCRAYGKPVVQGLVDTGYLSATEANGGVTVINWGDVKDAELLKELLRRIDSDGLLPGSIWEAPLDDNTTGTLINIATGKPVPEFDEAKHAANRGPKGIETEHAE